MLLHFYEYTQTMKSYQIKVIVGFTFKLQTFNDKGITTPSRLKGLNNKIYICLGKIS